jgi:hypothetical protein
MIRNEGEIKKERKMFNKKPKFKVRKSKSKPKV